MAMDEDSLFTDKTLDFQAKLEEFAFQSPETSARRTTRSTTRSLDGQARAVASAFNSLSKKRTVAAVEDRSPKKVKRGYAPPEIYAHLNYLADCLGEYLDVLFCGINPGVHSATVGHHFAHPGNKFYKMLYGAGFTDRLIPPEEDNTLPARFNIGITDIVDRPSKCEDELSAQEMINSVPALLSKVAKYKPRFVCFVGKGMGQKVEKGFSREISRFKVSPVNQVLRGAAAVPSRGEKPRQKKHPPKRVIPDSGIGLRPFKVTHDEPTSPVRETLFFISHSPSGLATSMTLQMKIDTLKRLKDLVDIHKSGTIDTSSMEEVPVRGAATEENYGLLSS